MGKLDKPSSVHSCFGIEWDEEVYDEVAAAYDRMEEKRRQQTYAPIRHSATQFVGRTHEKAKVSRRSK